MSSSGPANFESSRAASSVNPYAPTASTASLDPVTGEAEAIRNKYLTHEASVQGIGTLYLLGAMLLVPLGIIVIAGAVATGGPSEAILVGTIGAFYLLFGLLQGYAGWGLRRLTGVGRILGIGFATIGLIGFPVGTLISIYILYLLLSEKGRVVFTDGYRQVVADTPHIKYKTSIIVWILLILLLTLIALAILAVLLAG